MSVASVASRPVLAQDNDPLGSGLIGGGYSGLTKIETMRLATRLTGIAGAGMGVATIPLAALGVVTLQMALLIAIPCAVVTGGVIWYNRQLTDYDNPNELEKFRRQAARLSLDSVIQAYGWNDTLRFGILSPSLFAEKYRHHIQGKNLLEIIAYFEKTLSRTSQCMRPKFTYEVPPPHESAGLWRQETATQTFEEIIRTYPLDKLEKYALVEQGELKCIKHLKREYEAIKEGRDKRVTQLDETLQGGTESCKHAYENRCGYANQTYYANDAVRELQSFEFHYARRRQEVQEQRDRIRIEARNRFERAIAATTNNGQIPYTHLSTAGKADYDQHETTLRRTEFQAERTADDQIQQIHVQRNERLMHLSDEEARARGRRDQMLDDAKQRYNAEMRERHAPIEASFRSAAEDFNGRYRAYLRTVSAF